ncbi:MAG: 5'-deoxynucleotidase [Ruminococcus bromii]|uniref:5'-deoxynucleotidase n=1 Tax=Ruminococcus sp. YE282 TaxID=3158780 RepID=UPI00087E9B7B|nr:5'-deoxynucleotidase [Ruminococcus bromii]MDD6434004.1 5'-deoxynucleotidase [Ruminococcus bromii]MDY4084013.1 5'-deoxynucleotidase [Ruminococcus bromii]MDY4711471.1 5'-deoxynucleotidase [Ruminococcus bromii]MEE3498534.1 5'-deoxynucleotidase [Ruminococcus bromii]
MPYHFYAMMSRMKYINRWGLMNNTKNENISEHSQQVAIIAHCLVLIHNKRFGGHLDAERAAVLAIFHDSTEIITGDMPTPIKYFNPQINEAYKKIENVAADKLISMLPEDFKEDFEEIIKANGEQDKELKKYVKAADKFSALIKCIEELRMGNDEFIKAKDTIEASLKNMNLPEAEVFEKEFLPSFSLALDEQE